MDYQKVLKTHPWVGLVAECGDGWADILDRLFFGIENRIKDLGQDIGSSNLRILQIKEKFGELRFYYQSNIDFSDLIEAAVEESARTCEECGKPGALSSNGRWLMVRCDEHMPQGATAIKV